MVKMVDGCNIIRLFKLLTPAIINPDQLTITPVTEGIVFK
jgi:hypothetical protein